MSSTIKLTECLVKDDGFLILICNSSWNWWLHLTDGVHCWFMIPCSQQSNSHTCLKSDCPHTRLFVGSILNMYVCS